MSGKVSTTNYKEYKADKSLIFIPKEVIKTLKSIKTNKVIRCDNPLCRRVLPLYQPKDDNNNRFTTYLKYGRNNYCDVWCKEEDNKKEPTHFCSKCGDEVESFRYTKDTGSHKKGSKTHIYPKYCKQCRYEKTQNKIQNKQSKVI